MMRMPYVEKAVIEVVVSRSEGTDFEVFEYHEMREVKQQMSQ